MCSYRSENADKSCLASASSRLLLKSVIVTVSYTLADHYELQVTASLTSPKATNSLQYRKTATASHKHADTGAESSEPSYTLYLLYILHLPEDLCYTITMKSDEPYKGIYVVTFDVSQPDEYEYEEYCGLSRETWRESDRIHRHNGPAIILRNEKGQIVRQEYYNDGKLHRAEGNPAIECLLNGSREWLENGVHHREGGPSIETRNSPHEPARIIAWHHLGNLHRVGGPSYIVTDTSSGVIELEEWHQHGKLHRADGPAHIERDYRSGQVVIDFWSQNGISYRHQTADTSEHAPPALKL